jgi:iron complex transport system substrate-binding protein
MLRRLAWIAIAVVIGATVAACERDAEKRAVATRADGDPRVVSLTPSATEVVAALDATAFLVGVDDYSSYPPEVATLPKVGSFLTPNLEAIAALHPTLVIVDDIHGKAARALEQLGVRTIECPMHALPDVKSALTRVGEALGRSELAAARVAAIEEALDAAAAKRPAKRPRVLLVIDRTSGGLGGLVAAGPGSWLDELVAVAGGENVLAGASVRYPKISREEIMRFAPEVLVDAAYVANEEEPMKDWAELTTVPAIAGRRVYAAKQAFMLAPSPRVAEALAAIQRMLGVQ